VATRKQPRIQITKRRSSDYQEDGYGDGQVANQESNSGTMNDGLNSFNQRMDQLEGERGIRAHSRERRLKIRNANMIGKALGVNKVSN